MASSSSAHHNHVLLDYGLKGRTMSSSLGSQQHSSKQRARAKQKTASGQMRVQPLSLQVKKGILAPPHDPMRQHQLPLDREPSILAPEREPSARRSKFETAMLKDENITLTNEVTRRAAEVEAHRFVPSNAVAATTV